MNRREWIKCAVGLAAAPWVERVLPASLPSKPGSTFPPQTKQILVAAAETLFPVGNHSPGANGEQVVRLIEDRLSTDKNWLRFYTQGLNQLERLARKLTHKSFASLSVTQRTKILSSFWKSIQGTPAENFLESLKQDVLNEVLTTKTGLKWLGYKGRVQGFLNEEWKLKNEEFQKPSLIPVHPQNPSGHSVTPSSTQGFVSVLIVGGGAAGLTVAYSLALKGVSVMVLEFGPLPEPVKEFRTDAWPDELPLRGLGNRGMEYYPSNHFTAEKNAPYVLGNEVSNSWLKRTRVAGGKTLYWTAHSLRFSDFEFRSRTITGQGEDWPVEYADLEAYYTQAEQLMGVTGSPAGLAQQPDGVFLPPLELRAGEKILHDVLHRMRIPMIPARKAILTTPYQGRSACHYTGRCFLGCKTSAKFDAVSALLPAALATGKLTFRPNSVVLEVLCDRRGRASGVRLADRNTGVVSMIQASVVVLAASAIETARLLLNSSSPDGGRGLANEHDLVGRYLTESVGVRVEGLLPQLQNTEVLNTEGTGEHGLIPRFVNLSAQSKSKYSGGFLFMTQSGPEIFPSFAAHLPGFGEDWKQSIRSWYPASIRLYGIAPVSSRPENRIVLDSVRRDDWGKPVAKAEFSLNDEDQHIWQAMSDYAQDFLDVAGADLIQVGQTGPETGGGLHAAGTCRMGTDPKTSVVNSFGQAHSIKNLFVADASVFVSSLNQPTLTLMALALRTADFIAQGLKRGDW